LGLAVTIAGIVELARGTNNKIWEYTPWSWGTALSSVLLAAGLFTLFSGLTGVIGGKKKNNFCLCCYQITIFILLIIFFVFAIVATVIVHDFVQPMGDNVSNNGCTYYNRDIPINCVCGN